MPWNTASTYLPRNKCKPNSWRNLIWRESRRRSQDNKKVFSTLFLSLGLIPSYAVLVICFWGKNSVPLWFVNRPLQMFLWTNTIFPRKFSICASSCRPGVFSWVARRPKNCLRCNGPREGYFESETCVFIMLQSRCVLSHRFIAVVCCCIAVREERRTRKQLWSLFRDVKRISLEVPWGMQSVVSNGRAYRGPKTRTLCNISIFTSHYTWNYWIRSELQMQSNQQWIFTILQNMFQICSEPLMGPSAPCAYIFVWLGDSLSRTFINPKKFGRVLFWTDNVRSEVFHFGQKLLAQ